MLKRLTGDAAPERTAGEKDVSVILLDKVADWLTRAALDGQRLDAMVQGFCERLSAAGMPLLRAHLSFSMLHPLYDALGFTWVRGKGIEVEGFRTHDRQPGDRFIRSPYYYMISNDMDFLRRRVDASTAAEFPILKDLLDMGASDYLAFTHSFSSTEDQGMIGSWATDMPGGFSDNMIAELLRMQGHLAVASKMAVLSKLADNMLTTYLGGEAGKRVLNGKIRRGEGDTIRAALVMADMRGSTHLAETAGREAYIDTLNQFFDAIATPFNRDGGQILSFLGDGFLALYPCDDGDDPNKACRAALKAANKAAKRMDELNARRAKEGLAEIGYGIGLHVGNVMFGNVGLSDRLTFSVFGSAVNEVQRLQVLTKKHPHHIVASKEFAGYCGGDGWLDLGKERLAGIEREVSVLTPGPAMTRPEDDGGQDAAPFGHMSDAEQLILLHRGANPTVETHAKKLQ